MSQGVQAERGQRSAGGSVSYRSARGQQGRREGPRLWQARLHTRERLQTIVHTEGEQESAKAKAPGQAKPRIHS